MLKRLISSSSSEGEMGIGVGCGGRIRGARKKMIGRERRRKKVRTNGVENIEFVRCVLNEHKTFRERESFLDVPR